MIIKDYRRRSINFNGRLLGTCLLLLVTACGGGGGAVRATPVTPPPPPEPSPPTGLLIPFTSNTALVDRVQASFQRQLQTLQLASADTSAPEASQVST
ncbi:MAG: hypothetical protein QNL99_08840, partial [SAR86 cluster bacterium]